MTVGGPHCGAARHTSVDMTLGVVRHNAAVQLTPVAGHMMPSPHAAQCSGPSLMPIGVLHHYNTEHSVHSWRESGSHARHSTLLPVLCCAVLFKEGFPPRLNPTCSRAVCICYLNCERGTKKGAQIAQDKVTARRGRVIVTSNNLFHVGTWKKNQLFKGGNEGGEWVGDTGRAEVHKWGVHRSTVTDGVSRRRMVSGERQRGKVRPCRARALSSCD